MTNKIDAVAVLSAHDAVHVLRMALVQAECAIKGREHTGFITRALVATEHIGAERAAIQPAGEAVYAILFDEHDKRPVVVLGEKAARANYERIGGSGFNAHLFVKLESNSRDDPYYHCNLATPQDAKASGCRMTGGICACRSGGSFGGCAKERADCCANEPGRQDAKAEQVSCALRGGKCNCPTACQMNMDAARIAPSSEASAGELPFGADNLARLMRNLEDTSYTEGSEALACRLSDCRTVITELLADRLQRDAVAASGAGVPDGWMLVPSKETPEWREKLQNSGYSHRTVFRDVLAAAPTPDRATKAEAAPGNAGVVPVQWENRLRLCPSQSDIHAAKDAEISDLRAALAAPTMASISEQLHYPECWDTAAYPTVQDALREVAAFVCGECKSQPAAAVAGEAVMDERRGGTLYEATMRACSDLPEGYEIRIELENGCGLVRWIDDEGNDTVIESEGYLCMAVDEAFEAILAKSKGRA